MDDARLRRAGLDYREWVNIRIYDSYENLFRQYSHARRFIFSKWHTTIYSSVRFHSGDFLIFGSETSGLPVEIRESVDAEHQLILPMLPNSRSLNLSNAVAIIVYEAWRQNDFAFRD